MTPDGLDPPFFISGGGTMTEGAEFARIGGERTEGA